MLTQVRYADLLVKRLDQEKIRLAQGWRRNAHPFRHLWVDELLPAPFAQALYEAFPEPETMVLKKDLREHKWVTAQLDRYHPSLEEMTYAFQDGRVVRLISEITGIEGLQPDESLYAGGISLMLKGNFLAPHIDNSHDEFRKRYRRLNALYYLSPDVHRDSGGHLELWDEKVKRCTTVPSAYNRLVLMETHRSSWHSVSPLTADIRRCCISNYYFSEKGMGQEDYFHVTRFTGWPDERMKRVVLTADAFLRMGIRKALPVGLFQTSHVYKKRREP